MTDITIAIPTFRRPKGLARLLASLAELQTDAAVTVLVGDNDAETHQGYDLCAALKDEGYRWPLEAIVVTERGISQNRSALVARALERPGMQFLAMVDDDEWVQPEWLEALLRAQSQFDADAVEGRVIAVFKDGTTTGQYEGIAYDCGPSGKKAILHSSANILVTRRVLERMAPPHFDPQFALTGGEDKEFFVRLKALGARLAWSREAVIYSDVPQSRTGARWAFARAYRTGNSDMRVFLKHRIGTASLFGELAKIGGALLLSPLLALILALSPTRRMAALRKFCRAAGKTAALFGSHYQEYSVIHGE
ncbi:MAG: glycosyltransferase [Alphaproteobacteria bacterium]|nr:glycosyltransferase [Alphaproteobacteria bacterium]MBU6471749.1 glycosyltransferase [Alphaproteobacteria bacterium]MDE2013348.1 glycosyltransferase [Alphaproteobacteria bacterium]MDE2073887.1 glycosyltransferase [Alphaproteobacteria bacterium]